MRGGRSGPFPRTSSSYGKVNAKVGSLRNMIIILPGHSKTSQFFFWTEQHGEGIFLAVVEYEYGACGNPDENSSFKFRNFANTYIRPLKLEKMKTAE